MGERRSIRMPKSNLTAEAAGRWCQEDSEITKDLELARDVIETLTAKQKDLVIGLGRGSAGTIAILKDRIPKGTMELLESHDVIDSEGNMTRLGGLVADQLAFEAREGPDPRLVARALASEARLLAKHRATASESSKKLPGPP
jgi:hypothetical protein